MSDNMEKFYETKYWEEVEENIKLQEEIDNLKWKIQLLENKLNIKTNNIKE